VRSKLLGFWLGQLDEGGGIGKDDEFYFQPVEWPYLPGIERNWLRT
jgi:hypothetical protein